MAIKKLDKGEWQRFFDRLSKDLMTSREVEYAEVRVFSPEIGAQKATSWLPLEGITYDTKDDLIDLAVPNLDHMIYHPTEIFIDEASDGVLCSMEILRRDGTKEVVELR